MHLKNIVTLLALVCAVPVWAAETPADSKAATAGTTD
jgi:hypothetical protein